MKLLIFLSLVFTMTIPFTSSGKGLDDHHIIRLQEENNNIVQILSVPTNYQNYGTNVEKNDRFELIQNSLSISIVAIVLNPDKWEDKNGKKENLQKYQVFQQISDINGFSLKILLILNVEFPQIMSNQKLIHLLDSYQIKIIRAIQSLENMGLVEKKDLITDARQKGIILTNQGLEFLASISKLIISGM